MRDSRPGGSRQPMVAILWGRDASTLKPMLTGKRLSSRSNRRIPRRCRRRGDFSARVRSVAPTNCSPRWAPNRSTGSCRRPGSAPPGQIGERLPAAGYGKNRQAVTGGGDRDVDGS